MSWQPGSLARRTDGLTAIGTIFRRRGSLSRHALQRMMLRNSEARATDWLKPAAAVWPLRSISDAHTG